MFFIRTFISRKSWLDLSGEACYKSQCFVGIYLVIAVFMGSFYIHQLHSTKFCNELVSIQYCWKSWSWFQRPDDNSIIKTAHYFVQFLSYWCKSVSHWCEILLLYSYVTTMEEQYIVTSLIIVGFYASTRSRVWLCLGGGCKHWSR